MGGRIRGDCNKNSRFKINVTTTPEWHVVLEDAAAATRGLVGFDSRTCC